MQNSPHNESPEARASDVENDTKSVRDSQWAQYQSWLRLHARIQIDAQFRGKFDESDIAQQTMIEAWRSQSNFRGTSEGERQAWLRQILANVLGHEMRRYRGTKKRDLSRERSLEQSLENSMAQSSAALRKVIPSGQASPSQIAQHREDERLLADAMDRLPKDYREVILLRNMEMLSHEEIAQHMGKTTTAVRMLWLRALKQLKREVDG